MAWRSQLPCRIQITQNTILRIATGCTTDTNTLYLQDILPIKEHLQLNASHIRQNLHHPLHYIATHKNRCKKHTIFNNTPYTTDINTNPNTINYTQNKHESHTQDHSQQHISQNTTKLLTPYHSTYIMP